MVQRKKTRLAGSYWSSRGKYQKLYDDLYERLVPDYGNADTEAGELLRAISKIYYDLYNNGWGNGPWEEEWDIISNFRGEIRRNMEDPAAFEEFENFFYRTNYGEEVMGRATPELSQLIDAVVDGVVLTVQQTDESRTGSRRTAGLKEDYQRAVDQAEVLNEKIALRAETAMVELETFIKNARRWLDGMELNIEDFGSEFILGEDFAQETLARIAFDSNRLKRKFISLTEWAAPLYDEIEKWEELYEARWREMKTMSPEALDYLNVVE